MNLDALIPPSVDGFSCSTPEMKARDEPVPFLLFKLKEKIHFGTI